MQSQSLNVFKLQGARVSLCCDAVMMHHCRSMYTRLALPAALWCMLHAHAVLLRALLTALASDRHWDSEDIDPIIQPG